MLFEPHTQVTDSNPDATLRPRSKAGLSDTVLRGLAPRDKTYKVTDGQGMYVSVSTSGTKTFRYDYRLDGKRETLTVGRYQAGTVSRTGGTLADLEYGDVVSLKDARALRDRASREVDAGRSPSKSKALKRTTDAHVDTFGGWAQAYFEFKSDPKSGDEQLAESTLKLPPSHGRVLA